jgi:hypothetical protein
VTLLASRTIDKRVVAERRLVAIKLFHTVVWGFFAGSIVVIPIAAFADRFLLATSLAGVVLIEVLILVANRWTCPLTAVAARYTTERRPNFDIYLPSWLARHNKTIFGALYVAGIVATGLLWVYSTK